MLGGLSLETQQTSVAKFWLCNISVGCVGRALVFSALDVYCHSLSFITLAFDVVPLRTRLLNAVPWFIVSAHCSRRCVFGLHSLSSDLTGMFGPRPLGLGDGRIR